MLYLGKTSVIIGLDLVIRYTQAGKMPALQNFHHLPCTSFETNIIMSLLSNNQTFLANKFNIL